MFPKRTMTTITIKDTYTAWELCGDWWWVYEGYLCYLSGGKAPYETATATKDLQNVRLWALREGLHQVRRYVAPDTPMVLRKANNP